LFSLYLPDRQGRQRAALEEHRGLPDVGGRL